MTQKWVIQPLLNSLKSPRGAQLLFGGSVPVAAVTPGLTELRPHAVERPCPGGMSLAASCIGIQVGGLRRHPLR